MAKKTPQHEDDDDDDDWTGIASENDDVEADDNSPADNNNEAPERLHPDIRELISALASLQGLGTPHRAHHRHGPAADLPSSPPVALAPSGISLNAAPVTQNFYINIGGTPERKVQREVTAMQRRRNVAETSHSRPKEPEHVGPGAVTSVIDAAGKRPSPNKANRPQAPPQTPTRNTGLHIATPQTPGPYMVAFPRGWIPPPTDAGAGTSSGTSARVPERPDVESIHPMQRWYVVHKGINPGVALGIAAAKVLKGSHIPWCDKNGRMLKLASEQEARALFEKLLNQGKVERFCLDNDEDSAYNK